MDEDPQLQVQLMHNCEPSEVVGMRGSAVLWRCACGRAWYRLIQFDGQETP